MILQDKGYEPAVLDIFRLWGGTELLMVRPEEVKQLVSGKLSAGDEMSLILWIERIKAKHEECVRVMQFPSTLHPHQHQQQQPPMGALAVLVRQ